MKVLLINNFHYRKGGSEAVYFNTADVLRKAGHKVVFFSHRDERNLPCKQSEYFIPNNESVSRFKGMIDYFYNTEAKRRLEKLIINEHPDIAHVHLFWGGISPSIFGVLKRHRIPLIHTAHDYRMVCPAYTFNSKGDICEECAGRHFYKCAMKRCSKGRLIESILMSIEMYERNLLFDPAKHLSGIIYVSEFSRKKHLQYAPRLVRVPSCVLHNYTDDPPQSLLDRFERKYYLFFGRLSYEKGVDKLIDTFLELPEIPLKIVGSGPLEAELKRIVATRNARNIEFAGYKTGFELQSIVSDAAFVIVPSRWYENNPMTIIEAYSLQTPVIGANLGGIPEIVKEGRTGFLFDPNASTELLRNVKRSIELSDDAYRRMALECHRFHKMHFSKESYILRLERFYNQILNGKQ